MYRRGICKEHISHCNLTHHTKRKHPGLRPVGWYIPLDCPTPDQARCGICNKAMLKGHKNGKKRRYRQVDAKDLTPRIINAIKKKKEKKIMRAGLTVAKLRKANKWLQ